MVFHFSNTGRPGASRVCRHTGHPLGRLRSPTSPTPGDMGHPGFVVILASPSGGGGIPCLQHRETWGTQGLWSDCFHARGEMGSLVSKIEWEGETIGFGPRGLITRGEGDSKFAR